MPITYPAPTSTGTVVFQYSSFPPDLEAQTWYAVYGDLQNTSSSKPPLILLHGGPGMGHNYMLPLTNLSLHPYGRTVVLYDQFGCGKSTHFRSKRLDKDFWTPEIFMAELENLVVHLKIDHFDLLGQSWGGMLASQTAINIAEGRYAGLKGLRRLMILNSPASMELWSKSCRSLIDQLPPAAKATIDKYEAAQDYGNQEYQDAVTFFYKRHLCRVGGDTGKTFPDCILETMKLTEEDDTVYFTMNGPSEFTVVGNLRSWSVVGQLHKIQVPTLLLSGEMDEAQPLCVQPYADEIPNNEWEVVKDTSHCTHIEKNKYVCDKVDAFLKA